MPEGAIAWRPLDLNARDSGSSIPAATQSGGKGATQSSGVRRMGCRTVRVRACKAIPQGNARLAP